jgi:hypothetical protein
MLPREMELELMIKCTHELKNEKITITILIALSPLARCILIQ